MTLEDYLKEEHEKGVIDHAIRANVEENGKVTFYIHPATKGGMTEDFVVYGNTLVSRY